METLPTTILEFEKRFREEEDCVVYLRRVRWPNGFICPKCGHVECYELNLRLYQCALCKKQTSVTAGTIFHKTHLPLTIWFRVIFSVAQDKGGASSSRIASQFGLPQKTAWLMLLKLRTAMADRNELTKLEGIIELMPLSLPPWQSRSTSKADGLHAHHELRRMGHGSDLKPAPGKMGVEKLPWMHTFVSLIRKPVTLAELK